MLPITLLTTRKALEFLQSNNSLQQEIATVAEALGSPVPTVPSGNIVLSSVSADFADRNIQLTYPRVCIYAAGVKNTQLEKYRSFSGSVSIVTEITASGNLIEDTEMWIHVYVEALTGILRSNIGNWGDGVFFGGMYDVQLQAPKNGGLGFVQSARVTFSVSASQG